MNKQSKSNIFFFLFILIILSAAFYKAYTASSPKEAFGCALGEYPKSQAGRILPNTMFPYTSGKKQIIFVTRKILMREHALLLIFAALCIKIDLLHPML